MNLVGEKFLEKVLSYSKETFPMQYETFHKVPFKFDSHLWTALVGRNSRSVNIRICLPARLLDPVGSLIVYVSESELTTQGAITSVKIDRVRGDFPPHSARYKGNLDVIMHILIWWCVNFGLTTVQIEDASEVRVPDNRNPGAFLTINLRMLRVLSGKLPIYVQYGFIDEKFISEKGVCGAIPVPIILRDLEAAQKALTGINLKDHIVLDFEKEPIYIKFLVHCSEKPSLRNLDKSLPQVKSDLNEVIESLQKYTTISEFVNAVYYTQKDYHLYYYFSLFFEVLLGLPDYSGCKEHLSTDSFTATDLKTIDEVEFT